MQLPFVLQSAEVMKAAVAYLEQYMDKADSTAKGTMVLATVKGDVHDIGKNLVDIILTNNGYRGRQPRHQVSDRDHAARRGGTQGGCDRDEWAPREIHAHHEGEPGGHEGTRAHASR